MNERWFNKLLLAYLNDLRGIPQTEVELNDYVQRRLHKPSPAEAARALTYLESAGYIEQSQATAADAPLWKITAGGIRQITKNVKPTELDPMVHG